MGEAGGGGGKMWRVVEEVEEENGGGRYGGIIGVIGEWDRSDGGSVRSEDDESAAGTFGVVELQEWVEVEEVV